MAAGIVLPGIGGSGADHWQSHWEAADPTLRRFQPGDWDRPDLDNWQAALDTAIARSQEPPVLVAHSLSCLLVAHAGERLSGRIAGAFLVAVPDTQAPAFPAAAAGFRHPPHRPLPFPALVLASTDDPFGSLDHARQRAHAWGAGLVTVGALGHINAASGLGPWQDGRMLLDAFRAGLRS
ncbi:serine hydrolase family protein [Aquabacter sp. L1I39]|uniref:RBBP9/YdeN family alpha/beta hydrolase n=1 Tax=Aquabacter sp. L1I39 TaxID=2820278 RepID=UPI001AD960F1|nr:alpha/beta hydrolase [Aquabacter sp. L1I39]QTL04665.1 serine hydrolase family protein [Aquabacter sp. L1I39]